MPEGYVELLPRDAYRRALLRQLRERVEVVGGPGAQDPRPARQVLFDAGDPPLPGYSWPPPRATGWER